MANELDSMITHTTIQTFDKFYKGAFDIVIHIEVNSDGKEIYFLSFETDSKDASDSGILFSQNKVRREFKSLDTLKSYLLRYCSTVRSITIKTNTVQFPFLKSIKLK